MVDATHKSFRADDRSYFSILKKEIHNQVALANYSQKKIAEIDIIVSELTSNLNKFAKEGEILFAHVTNNEQDYIEIICIDNGPGMIDASKMITDGVSTSNTLGHGLGSLKRLSDKFEIYSLKDWGTITLNRIYKNSSSKKKLPVDIHALVLPKPGEEVSGDGFFSVGSSDFLKFLVADGLGHGVEANKAVNAAVEAFQECQSNDPAEILKFIHPAIKKTRGIVGTILIYDIKRKLWNTAGIGNISMKMMNGSLAKNHLPYNGIVGHNIPNTIKVQQFSCAEFNQLILCSDGIKSRWDLSKYPMIGKYDLSILAAAIYKDFGRKTDDMSVIIAKCN